MKLLSVFIIAIFMMGCSSETRFSDRASSKSLLDGETIQIVNEDSTDQGLISDNTDAPSTNDNGISTEDDKVAKNNTTGNRVSRDDNDDDDDDGESCDDDEERSVKGDNKTPMTMTPEEVAAMGPELDEICCSHGRKILICDKDIDSDRKKTLCLDAEELGILVKGETVSFLGACPQTESVNN